jgi:carbon monoxide dehydrogenase subunit G
VRRLRSATALRETRPAPQLNVANENGTQLSVRAHLEIGGFFKMAEGLVGKQAKKQIDADFEALERFLEAGEV